MENRVSSANGIFNGAGIGDVTAKLVDTQGVQIRVGAPRKTGYLVTFAQQMPDDGFAQKSPATGD